MKLFFKPAAIAAVGAAVGCAKSTAPPPNAALAAPPMGIGRAQTTAPAVPDAKLHLELAQESLQRSKTLLGRGNGRAATRVAEATVEARLAETLMQKVEAEDQARQDRDALEKQASP